MRRRVVRAQAGKDDYLAAIRFIARDDPDAAMRVAERIEAAGDALAAFATGRRGSGPRADPAAQSCLSGSSRSRRAMNSASAASRPGSIAGAT